jgi:putative ABC transport system substrate-binding protein
MIKRRSLFIAAASIVTAPRILLAVTASLPSVTHAQTRPRRIGFLWNGLADDPVLAQRVTVFKAAMRALGYAEGRDYVIEQRFAANDLPRLPALAADLVAMKVDAIVSGGGATIRAARDATRDIPILTTVSSNLVAAGFVSSLSRPGGNITGLTSLTSELYPKRLELLQQIVPAMRRLGILYDAQSTNVSRTLEPVSRKLGLQTISATVDKGDVQSAFRTLQRASAQGLIVGQSGGTIALKQAIAQQAASHGLPAVYPLDVFAEAGGLISYSENTLDLYRRLAGYVDKIFKGIKPADLPVEQPTKFELVVNMKTAKALGIAIPQSILVSADRVIE